MLQHGWTSRLFTLNEISQTQKYCMILLTWDTSFSQSVSSALSRVWLFVTSWSAACQASLSITNSRSLLKFMSIESGMPSNHLIFCCSLLLLPSILPSIRVFSTESVLPIRWPKYWSFSFSIRPGLGATLMTLSYLDYICKDYFQASFRGEGRVLLW